MCKKVYGKANLEKTQKYSTLYLTDMSRKLDQLFRLNILNWEARKAYKLSSAQDNDFLLTMILEEDNKNYNKFKNLLYLYQVSNCPYKGLTGEIDIVLPEYIKDIMIEKRDEVVKSQSSETVEVIDFFLNQAQKVGYFFALPYDDIIKASSNEVNKEKIKLANLNGYVRIYKHPNEQNQTLIELTSKFYDSNTSRLNDNLESLIYQDKIKQIAILKEREREKEQKVN